jgi:hypothetical protein
MPYQWTTPNTIATMSIRKHTRRVSTINYVVKFPFYDCPKRLHKSLIAHQIGLCPLYQGEKKTMTWNNIDENVDYDTLCGDDMRCELITHVYTSKATEKKRDPRKRKKPSEMRSNIAQARNYATSLLIFYVKTHKPQTVCTKALIPRLLAYLIARGLIALLIMRKKVSFRHRNVHRLEICIIT